MIDRGFIHMSHMSFIHPLVTQSQSNDQPSSSQGVLRYNDTHWEVSNPMTHHHHWCPVSIGISSPQTNMQSVVPLVAIMGNHPNKVVQPCRTFANWVFSQSSSAQNSRGTKKINENMETLSAQASTWLVNQLLSTRFISTSKSTTPSMTGSVCSLNKFAMS